ncbi:MAG: DUF1257 domain-containing protein [Dehalococcoidia bacterium]|nr:DUF1257 domain-containing protein [Dehalococcoidia bacterium]
MSHITTIEVEVKDLQALEKACERLGLTLARGQTTFKWYGSQAAACAHAIKVPGANYEVGVVQKGRNFTLQADFFDYHLGGKVGPNGQKLIQAYAVEAAKAQARKQGYSVREEAQADGTIVLRARVAA